VPSVEAGGLGWSMLSTRRERPTTSERRINSYIVNAVNCGPSCLIINMVEGAYLSHIRTHLPRFRQEIYPRHPFISRKSRFPREVMDVRDKSFEDVLEAWILASRIDQMNIVRNVLNCKVF
jgi:hypothetical protein